MSVRQRSIWGLGALLCCAVGGAHAQSDSCLMGTAAARLMATNANQEPANTTHMVLRPCRGRLKEGRATVIYGIGDGVSRELTLGAGDYVEQKLATALGPGKQLADVWPKRGVLTAVLGILTGQRTALTGTSGFEGASNTLPLTGSLLMIDGTPLSLALHGLDPAQPVALVQGSRRVVAKPDNGRAVLQFSALSPGLATLEQGSRRFSVKLVPLSDEPELAQDLRALTDGQEDPSARQLRRAILLQEAQYPVNAAAEYMAGRVQP